MVRKKDPEFTLDRDVIFNTLEEGIIAINTQAEVIYINRSAAEMLPGNLSPGTLTMQPAGYFQVLSWTFPP